MSYSACGQLAARLAVAVFTVLLLLQGCATPMPVSDLPVHTQDSRLKDDLEMGRTCTIHAQTRLIYRILGVHGSRAISRVSG